MFRAPHRGYTCILMSSEDFEVGDSVCLPIHNVGVTINICSFFIYLLQLQVRKLHVFMKESFPNAEFLPTAVVSRELVEQLAGVADEAVAQRSWFEVRGLPSIPSLEVWHIELCISVRKAVDY